MNEELADLLLSGTVSVRTVDRLRVVEIAFCDTDDGNRCFDLLCNATVTLPPSHPAQVLPPLEPRPHRQANQS